MAKKRGLGRGLDALLSGTSGVNEKAPTKPSETPLAEKEQAREELSSASSQPASAETVDGSVSVENNASNEHLRELPIEFLQRGKYQPRKDMHPEALEELAASIKAQGLMQPIVVRPISKNKYEIIAGERRWRASQIAQLDTIPALIKDVPDEAAVAMALIENIQREDLNPIEEAEALYRLQQEFELTHQEVASAVGKSRTAVSNLLRLMGLAPGVKTLLENGDIEMGHARAVLSLSESQQAETARNVVARGLSVRQTEELVRKAQKSAEQAGSSKIEQSDTDTKQLQDDLSEKLGASVLIQHSAKGKGKVVISYNSLDELDGILAHIK